MAPSTEANLSPATHLVVLGTTESDTQVRERALLVQLLQVIAVDVVFILSAAPKVQVAGARCLPLWDIE